MKIKGGTENQAKPETLGKSSAASNGFQSTDCVLIGVPIETRPSSADQELPPQVSVEELPSLPGCRTLATKTCYKTPVIINKKVSQNICQELWPKYMQFFFCQSLKSAMSAHSLTECNIVFQVPVETCRFVPDVECHTLLRDVPDIEGSYKNYTIDVNGC